jgi:hypothetical protein
LAAPLAAPAAIGYAGVPALGYAEAGAPIAAAAPAIGYAGVAAQAIGYAGVAAPAIGYAEVAAPLTAVETIQAGPAITQTEVHQGVVGSRTVQASKKLIFFFLFCLCILFAGLQLGLDKICLTHFIGRLSLYWSLKLRPFLDHINQTLDVLCEQKTM